MKIFDAIQQVVPCPKTKSIGCQCDRLDKLSEAEETVKAIAEEMDIRPAILNKAIKVAHKANFGEESDKFDELETILAAIGKDSL